MSSIPQDRPATPAKAAAAYQAATLSNQHANDAAASFDEILQAALSAKATEPPRTPREHENREPEPADAASTNRDERAESTAVEPREDTVEQTRDGDDESLEQTADVDADAQDNAAEEDNVDESADAPAAEEDADPVGTDDTIPIGAGAEELLHEVVENPNQQRTVEAVVDEPIVEDAAVEEAAVKGAALEDAAVEEAAVDLESGADEEVAVKVEAPKVQRQTPSDANPAPEKSTDPAALAPAQEVVEEAEPEQRGKRADHKSRNATVESESAPANSNTARPQVEAPAPAAQRAVANNVEPAAPDTTGDAPNRSAAPVESAPVANSVSASRLQQQMVGGARRANAQTQQLTEADQTRFVNRVARAFQSARERGGPLRLRLHPPELGSLRLEVKVENGALTARVEAETAAARTALMDNLNILRNRLAEQGLRVDQFDVDMMDRRANDQAQQGGEGNTEQDANNRREAEHAAPDDLAEARGPRGDVEAADGDDGIDVLV